MHHEHSLRVVDTLERDGRGLNLTEPVRDGIVSHSGRAQEPSTLEGKIVRLMDRVAYINHDIDDALRAGLLSRRSAGGADRDPRRHRVAADRHARPRPGRELRARRRHRPGGDGRWGDVRAAGRSCSSACTSVPRRLVSTRRSGGVIKSLFDHYCAHPERDPGLGPAGELAAARDRLARRNDRPVLHPHVRGAEPCRWRSRREQVHRRFARSRARAVDMIAVVSEHTELRRAGVTAYVGRCPFHEERTPVVRRQPRREGLPLLRLSGLGRACSGS